MDPGGRARWHRPPEGQGQRGAAAVLNSDGKVKPSAPRPSDGRNGSHTHTRPSQNARREKAGTSSDSHRSVAKSNRPAVRRGLGAPRQGVTTSRRRRRAPGRHSPSTAVSGASYVILLEGDFPPPPRARRGPRARRSAPPILWKSGHDRTRRVAKSAADGVRQIRLVLADERGSS